MSQEKLLRLFNEGRFDEVVRLASSNQITPESNPASSCVLGASYFRLGDFQNAVDTLSLLESTHSQDLEYLSLFGASLRRLGDLNKAKAVFESALSIYPAVASLRNNYANLLIDLKSYDEAKVILEDLLNDDPNYTDASVNLNRLSFFLQNTVEAKSTSTLLKSSNEALDPLLQAFDEFEVANYGRLKNDNPVFTKVPDSNEREVGRDKLKLAEQAVSEGQYKFALELCTHAFELLGAQAGIYDCAADALIQLKYYHNAESFILHSASIHGFTVKHCINLVSLCLMRNDVELSSFYLQKAYSIDPSHSHLKNCEQLINNKRASLKDNSFKLLDILK